LAPAPPSLLRLSAVLYFSPLLAQSLRPYPVRGLRQLSEAVANAGYATRSALQLLLARHLAEHRDLLVPLLSQLPQFRPAARDLALQLLSEHDQRAPDAPWDDLPAALRDPPPGTTTPDWLGAVVAALSERGVTFEHYEGTPAETDDDGVFRGGGPLIAWFTDPSGNVMSVIEGPGRDG